MRILKIIVILFFLVPCVHLSAANPKGKESKDIKKTEKTEQIDKVIYLDKDSFIKDVFDFSQDKEWKYKGSLPCVIDLYADWCGPCRRVAPIMDELAKEYAGKLLIYKINVDKERELAQFFGASSIPLVIFVPMLNQPASQPGALSKEQYKKIIDSFIFEKK